MTSDTTGVPAQRSAHPPGAPLPGTPNTASTGSGSTGSASTGSASTGSASTGPAAPAGDLSDVPTGELVHRLSTQLSELVRRELELARTELAAKGKRAGAGAGLAGAGGVVGLFGVGALVAAAIAGLATVMPVWLSALIVGVVLLIVAGVLALSGRSRLRKATPPVPEQAVKGVQHDVSTLRNAVHR